MRIRVCTWPWVAIAFVTLGLATLGGCSTDGGPLGVDLVPEIASPDVNANVAVDQGAGDAHAGASPRPPVIPVPGEDGPIGDGPIIDGPPEDPTDDSPVDEPPPADDSGSGGAPPHDASILAASAFGSDDEGWRVQGETFVNVTAPLWDQAAGSVRVDEGSRWYWIAPEAFRGDQSAAYGGWLSFDLSWRGIDGCHWYLNDADRFVVLGGGGYTLYHKAPYGPEESPTNFAFHLHETGPWYDLATGARASELQMRTVLANVGQLKIRGGLYSGPHCRSRGSLDNVLLRAAE